MKARVGRHLYMWLVLARQHVLDEEIKIHLDALQESKPWTYEICPTCKDGTYQSGEPCILYQENCPYWHVERYSATHVEEDIQGMYYDDYLHKENFERRHGTVALRRYELLTHVYDRQAEEQIAQAVSVDQEARAQLRQEEGQEGLAAWQADVDAGAGSGGGGAWQARDASWNYDTGTYTHQEPAAEPDASAWQDDAGWRVQHWTSGTGRNY